MASPTPTYLFESCLKQSPPLPAPLNRLDEIIQAELRLLADDVPPKMESPSDLVQAKPNTIINDMGDYITQTTCVWAHLTASLVKGPHVDQAALEAHKQIQNENRCADLSPVAAMDMELTKLRKIRDLTAQYSKEVEKIWRQPSRTENKPAKRAYSSTSSADVKPKIMPGSGSVAEDNKGAVRRMLPGAPKTDHVSPADDGSGSDDSDDEDDERFSQEKMDALKTRGKGDHYCPKGLLCTKGGVDKDGNLIQFDRNSAFAYVFISSFSLGQRSPFFRQHCNKHRKPYRCNLAGCPNPVKKRRFARRDGLERHQKHVPHIITHQVAGL
ncbi:unnamed protein product [Clonostachys rosea]|uniref:C2H2-type domain-containing protein n=1 Tax=Bionectria ochroleuca TaxID=29856 RepID=A0ABY6TSV7_BIOOC|nr:unnamed protein product [Clonostachys rosea]